jgi:hypothetical protein
MRIFSDPVAARTRNLQLRRLLLYPVELRDQLLSITKNIYYLFNPSLEGCCSLPAVALAGWRQAGIQLSYGTNYYQLQRTFIIYSIPA